MAQRTPRASNRHSPQAMNTLVHIPDARHQSTGQQQQQEAFGGGCGEQKGQMSEDAKCDKESVKAETSADVLEQVTDEDKQGVNCEETEVMEEVNDAPQEEAKEDEKALPDD